MATIKLRRAAAAGASLTYGEMAIGGNELYFGNSSNLPVKMSKDGHTHTAAQITNFNSAVLALSPDGPRTPVAHTLNSHSDVAITSPSSGQVLKFNGSSWVNSTDSNTNNYVTGMTGDGNSTLTLTRSGLSNLTLNLAHKHSWSDMAGVGGISVIGKSTTSGGGVSEIDMTTLKSMLSLGTAAYTASTAYKASSYKPTWSEVTGKPDVIIEGDSRLTNARPASDVSAWAKAANPPSLSDIGALVETSSKLLFNSTGQYIRLGYGGLSQAFIKHGAGVEYELYHTGNLTPSSYALKTYVDNKISLKSNTDNRSVVTIPNDYNSKFEIKGLKYNNVIDITGGGTYSALLGIRGWSEFSGGDAHELAFDSSGRINHRSGATTSWGAWKTLIESDDSRLTDARPASDVKSWAKASTKPAYSWSEIGSKPTFSTVATSGSYNDLSNKPTIPSIPSILSVSDGTTGTDTTQKTINASNLKQIILALSPAGARQASDVKSWAKADNKPTYTYSEVGAAPATHSHSATELRVGGIRVIGKSTTGGGPTQEIDMTTLQGMLGLGSLAYSSATIPTNTSQLTNNSNFITSSGSITGNAGTATKLATPVKINGTDFDGSANITITAAPTAHNQVYTTINSIPTGNVLGRNTARSGAAEAITYANLKSYIGLGNVDNQSKATMFASPTFTGTTTTATLKTKASATTSAAAVIPVFTSSPASAAQTVVTRTPAQLLSDIGGQPASNAWNKTNLKFSVSGSTLTITAT